MEVNKESSQQLVDVKPTKKTSGLGIAALILGIISCLTCWIPILCVGALLPAVIGFVLGIVGIIRAIRDKHYSAVLPVIGTVLSTAAIIIFIVVMSITIKDVKRAHEPLKKDATYWQRYTTICEKPYKEIILQNAIVDFPLTLSSDHKKGLYIVLLGREDHILLIDMNSGNMLMKLENPLKSKSIQSAAFSSDGERVVTGGGQYYTDLSSWELLRGKKMKKDWTLCFWDLASGKQIGFAKGQDDYIRTVVYSPVGDKALSGGDQGDILLWDLEKMQILKRFVGHSSGIRRGCLTWAQDGKRFLSGSWDGSVRFWDVETGREVAYLQPGYGRVMSLALSPDGKYALSSYLSGPDQPVIYWDIDAQSEINRFGVPGNPWFADKQLHVSSVAFSPDGKTALFGLVFGTVLWWDLNEWKQIAMNRLYEDELAFVAFSAEGISCISMGCDIDRKTVKVKFWQLPDREIIKEQR